MAKFKFDTFMKIMLLYAAIDKRMDELEADGDLDTSDILALVFEFGEEIQDLIEELT